MINGSIRNMALVSHQSQGFYVISSSRRLSWSKRLQMKQCLTKCHMIGRTDYLSKQNICLSVGPPCFCVAKLKPLRISGFKGHAQNDDSETRANRLKVPQTSVRLEESGEVHNVPLSYASGANEGLETSSAIHRLFKKWLMILRAQPSNQDDDENLGEPPPSGETLQGNQSKARSGILKVAWSHFLALDATVKVPLLIFVPFYLAVNVKYGVEVSKDLTPLWVFGPLIVALYVMIIRGLWSLYAFTFFQTIKVIKNLPSYCILVFNYVFRGKLKEDVRAYLLQPILDIKNRDYKQLTRNKLKELQVWIMEKYLDFVESIWPYYCRTIRFLKKANLI